MKRPPDIQPPPPDLAASTGIACERCGNGTFENVFVMRHFSAIASPNGKDGIVPIPTFGYTSCGWVNVVFLPPELRPKSGAAPEPNPPAPEPPKSSLIQLVK